MRNVWIICRKELRSYFVSPVAYLLLAMFAVVFGFVPSAVAQVHWRLGTLVPRGTSYHHNLQAMAEEWRKAPHGGVTLTIYTDGTMGGEADMVRRMRIGQLQAAMLTVPGLAEIDPSVSALQKMPMMYESLEEARRWVSVYSHLVHLEQQLFDALARMIPEMPSEAQREAEQTNLPVIASQVERFRYRLAYWSKRKGDLEQR